MFIEKEYLFNGIKIKYLIDYPENYKENEKYPIIFYLHGFGFVESGIEKLKKDCPLRRERIPRDMPFILVVPLCNEKSWIFKFETMVSFFDYIISCPNCDKSKVYLSGSSMGAYSSWWFLLAKKEIFTAAVLCCGGGPYWASGFYRGLPIRLIHGTQDEIVLYRESEIMAEKINNAGGNVQLVLHSDLGHDVWTRTFTDPETYKWLMELSHQP